MPELSGGKRPWVEVAGDYLGPINDQSAPYSLESVPDDDRWFIKVLLEDIPVMALVDTGSSKSYISAEGRQHLPSPSKFSSICPRKVVLANGAHDTVSECGEVICKIQGRAVIVRLGYLPSLNVPLLLGLDLLTEFGIRVDAASKTWTIRGSTADIPFDSRPFSVGETISGVVTLSTDQQETLKQIVDNHLSEAQSQYLTPHKVKHEIDVGSNRPIRQRAYPVSPKIQAAICQEVDRMLAEEIIECSHSEWASPVVMVKKGDGTYRFCIDFRKVNQISKKDAYPLPNMSTILDQLRQASILSKIDLRQAYHQIPLSARSKEITAFRVAGKGLYHFKKMPYGLSGAPATFQRFLDSIIGPELEPHCFVYLDDIIIATSSFQDHCYYLRLVLRKLAENGLKINLDKCEFGCSELRYLGFLVNERGLQADPAKLEPVLTYPLPQNIKELRRFLGMMSWYRRFIPHLAELSTPLTDLLRKGVKWKWGEAQQTAFEKLRNHLVEPPVLGRPDFTLPFIIQTDASFSGLGAVLAQEVNGEEMVIAFASRTLTKAEQKYSATEKECLAVVWAIRKFRPYVEGFHFTVVTDHSSLTWLHSLNSPAGRLARWALELQEYDFQVRYRKGTSNVVPDALSRLLQTGVKPQGEPISMLHQDNETKQGDLWYDTKFHRVQKNPDQFPDWRITGDELLHHRLDPLKESLGDATDSWKVVLPKHRRLQALRENHDSPDSGHQGTDRTYYNLSRVYFWPRMHQEVAKYVKSCPKCQAHKPDQRPPTGLMAPREYHGPWHTVAADIMGPFPRSTKGFKYLLVLVDIYTKWVELFPLRSATGAIIARHLRETVYRWGTPKVLLTDNGTEFVNKSLEKEAQELGITLQRTPSYHPQANPTERVNRNLKAMIATYVGDYHVNWDRYLPEFMFVLNTSKHSSVGCSPSYLNLGRELDRPHVAGKTGAEKTTATILDWKKHLLAIQDLQKQVERNLLESSERQCRHYNLRRRDRRFEPGDLVLRLAHPLSSAAQGFAAKLAPRYDGPYRIKKKISSLRYLLADAGGREKGVAHVSQIKPYVSREDSVSKVRGGGV